MSTFVNTIDGIEILARRAYEDKDGNPLKNPFVLKHDGSVSSISNDDYGALVAAYYEGCPCFIKSPVNMMYAVVSVMNGVTAYANGQTLAKVEISADSDAHTVSYTTVGDLIYVASYNSTPFSELVTAFNARMMIVAYHDDQQFLLKKKTSTQFIFSGLNSRSWIGQDSGFPCTSELVCTSSGWSHNWKPLSNVIKCESDFFVNSDGVLTVGTHTDKAAVGEKLSGYIDNILSAGLVPTLRYWDDYMKKEMYLPLHSRGCCGYFFQHYGTRTYHIYIGRYFNDTTGATEYTISLSNGPVPNT